MQEFDVRSGFVEEHKDFTTGGLFIHLAVYQPTQSVEAFAHVTGTLVQIKQVR